MTDTRTELTAYLRGSFFPPLPHAYVDWVMPLLDDMREAVHAADYGDDRPINHRIEIPAAIVSTGVMPKVAIRQGTRFTIRLADLISALRLYDRFTIADDDESEN